MVRLGFLTLALLGGMACGKGAGVSGDGGTVAPVASGDGAPAAAKPVDAAPVVAPIDAAPAAVIDAARAAAIDAAPVVVDGAPAAVDAAPAAIDAAPAASVDSGTAAAVAEIDAATAAAAPAPDAAAVVEAPAAAPDAAAAAVAVPSPPDAAVVAVKPPEPTVPPPPETTPPPPPLPTKPTATEIVFDEPLGVGDVDVWPLLDAIERAKASLESCKTKTGKSERVRVQFHVGQTKIGLAAPAPDNPGDPSTARCIANRIKSANPKWAEGVSGILFVEAMVPPK